MGPQVFFAVEHRRTARIVVWYATRNPGTSSIRARGNMLKVIRRLWGDDQGQDIAEYAVMLAVILVLVVGTIRRVGTNSNTVLSNVAGSIQ